MKHHKKHLVLIVPSSHVEDNYENASTFQDALDVYNNEDIINEGVDIYSFDTVEEADAFVQGYTSGIGYLGEGMYFRKINE